MSDGRLVDKPSIIGRERAMIDGLTSALYSIARKEYDYGPVRETRRGSTFEIRMDDGRIAKVTVELDRVEFERVEEESHEP